MNYANYWIKTYYMRSCELCVWKRVYNMVEKVQKSCYVGVNIWLQTCVSPGCKHVKHSLSKIYFSSLNRVPARTCCPENGSTISRFPRLDRFFFCELLTSCGDLRLFVGVTDCKTGETCVDKARFTPYQKWQTLSLLFGAVRGDCKTGEWRVDKARIAPDKTLQTRSFFWGVRKDCNQNGWIMR